MGARISDVAAKRLLSYSETAREFGGTVWMWRSLVWSRELPVVVVRGKHYLDRQDLEVFLLSRKSFIDEPPSLISEKRLEQFARIKERLKLKNASKKQHLIANGGTRRS